jgi:hypothetical protein
MTAASSTWLSQLALGVVGVGPAERLELNYRASKVAIWPSCPCWPASIGLDRIRVSADTVLLVVVILLLVHSLIAVARPRYFPC